MAEKISRKELLKAPDEFLTLSEKVFLFVKDHSRQFNIGLVIVLVAIVLGLGLKWYRDYSAGQALIAYNQAMEKLSTPTKANSQSLEAAAQALEKLLADYPRTAPAKPALLNLGQLDFQLKKYEPAVKAYQQALAELRPEDQDLKPIIFDSLAYVFEAQGNLDQAVSFWQQVLALPGNMLKQEARVGLGRVLTAMGRKSEAQKNYQDLIEAFPETSVAELAKIKLAELNK